MSATAEKKNGAPARAPFATTDEEQRSASELSGNRTVPTDLEIDAEIEDLTPYARSLLTRLCWRYGYALERVKSRADIVTSIGSELMPFGYTPSSIEATASADLIMMLTMEDNLALAQRGGRANEIADAERDVSEVRREITTLRMTLAAGADTSILAANVPAASVLDADVKGSQATRLVEIVDAARADLFHTPKGDAYATVSINGSARTLAIDSRAFRDWLDLVYFKSTAGALSENSRQSAIGVLRARAVFDGPEHPVFVRIGEANGRTYLDLADDTGRAIELDGDGWRIVTPPVRFTRPAAMLALPAPVRDPSVTLDALWEFVIVRPEDRPRVLAWQVSSLRPRGPYYHLVLTGQQGSIKSSSARALRQVTDPNEAPLRMAIGDGRDVMISAQNSWFGVYDNLKHLTEDQSNALCCLSTGGAFATRGLFTNSEESILTATRPAILTGIEDIVTAGDLLDRSIRIECPVFAGKRRTEAEVDAAFAAVWPALLGALLDAVATGIRNLPAVADADVSWPRMADAAMFAVAALPSEMNVLRALRDAASDDHELTLEASPIGAEIRKLGTFEGTTEELLVRLNSALLGRTKPDKWPVDPTRLSGALRKIAPALAGVGVVVTMPAPKARPRLIRIAATAGTK